MKRRNLFAITALALPVAAAAQTHDFTPAEARQSSTTMPHTSMPGCRLGGLAEAAPALDLSLHADLGVLAKCRGISSLS